MLNEFKNEINELKSGYLAGQDEEIDDVTENTSTVCNNQLNFFQKYIEKDKPGLSSIRFPSQETIAERMKLRRQKAHDEDLSDMPPLLVFSVSLWEKQMCKISNGFSLQILT